MSADKHLWCASETQVKQANITQFLASIREDWKYDAIDYQTLHSFSIAHVDEFWKAVWKYAKIISNNEIETIRIKGDNIFDDNWFPDAKLNFAENMLRARDEKQEALVCINESGDRKALTYSDLIAEVSRAQQAFIEYGVAQGDRVVGYLPNTAEAVISMLAALSIGAIWAVVSPDLSAQAAIDRIGQLDPKILIVSDGARYNGREYDLLEKAKEVASTMQNLQATIVVPYLHVRPDVNTLPKGVTWEKVISARSPTVLTFKRLPFSTPAFVIFTSGTTGKPKCLVHSAGGVLLQFAKEHLLNADMKPGDRVFRFTTTTWMMWHWGVGTLAWGATVILYDGSPQYPSIHRLFDIAQDEQLTFFGPSAALLDAYVKGGLHPASTHNLRSIRTIYSGGMRVSANNYAYVYEKIKKDVYFASPSGGSDPMAAFVAGDPIGCVRAGEMACAALGMDIQILGESGEELEHGPGELVCASPFPSTPLYFWGVSDRSKLIDSYIGRFAGKWAQGDWIERAQSGGYILHGRSDATLKVRGIRIGTAEIYRPLEILTDLEECAAVEHQQQDESQIILYVKLKPGVKLNEGLKETISQTLRAGASPFHVPSKIIAVTDLPKNSAGKIMELAIKDAIHGRNIRNIAAISNPECLGEFTQLY